MATDKPKDGKCGRPVKKGGYCNNLPALPANLGGNGLCKFHGGFRNLRTAQSPSEEAELSESQRKHREKHGLYSMMLAATFRGAARDMYLDDATARLDLTPEIRTWRAKLVKWQQMIADGTYCLETSKNTIVDIDDLISKGTVILDKLLRTQKELHPEADASGELTVRLVMDQGDQKAADELDMPDLEAPTPREDRGNVPLTPEPEVEESDSPLKDYEDND